MMRILKALGFWALAIATPSLAFAGSWGAEAWGTLAWGAPGVPTLPLFGLICLALGMMLGVTWSLGRIGPSPAASGRFLLCAFLLAVPMTAYAATITLPHVFANGSIADAEEVNANFDAIVVESNDQDARLTSNENALASLTPIGGTCSFAKVCPTGFTDRGIGGIIMLNSDHASHCSIIGSPGAAFNSNFSFCHPRICCAP